MSPIRISMIGIELRIKNYFANKGSVLPLLYPHSTHTIHVSYKRKEGNVENLKPRYKNI